MPQIARFCRFLFQSCSPPEAASVLPYKKVLSWFKAPTEEDDEIIVCNNDSSFVLDNLSDMKIDSQIADRGYDYYMRNKVVYISVDNTHGRAIVTGSNPYEVEFTYKNGEISNLLCDCFCSYTCKHEFATMLQVCRQYRTQKINKQELYWNIVQQLCR